MTTFSLKLSPQRRDDRLLIEKLGATLILNGEVYDPAEHYEGLSCSRWIVGRPEPLEDGWSVTVILPHGSPAPRATRFPEPIKVSADGSVDLPPYEGPDEDHEQLRVAVAAKLSERVNLETEADDLGIKIPPRLVLKEMPEGVYFSETAFPFYRFPAFGATVAHVVGTASLLDLEMLRVAISQHESEALLAVRSIFSLIRDDKQRANYIRSYAKSTGRPSVAEIIDWAYSYAHPVYLIRNAFAHHIWGECPAVSDALLLADPMDRLYGQAAHSQLWGHQSTEKEAQTLMRIATGDSGSKLSEDDAKAIFEMVVARQNNPSRVEAFRLTFANPLDFRAPAAEIWTARDFKNAAIAADYARANILPRLQQVSQWLNGFRDQSELKPLPPKPPRRRKN